MYLSIARAPLDAASRNSKWERCSLLVLDREHALHDDGALELDGHEPGDEVDALEHHRPALLQRPLERGADADHDVARLVEEAGDGRVVRLLGGVQRGGRLEARVVDRRA